MYLNTPQLDAAAGQESETPPDHTLDSITEEQVVVVRRRFIHVKRDARQAHRTRLMIPPTIQDYTPTVDARLNTLTVAEEAGLPMPPSSS